MVAWTDYAVCLDFVLFYVSKHCSAVCQPHSIIAREDFDMANFPCEGMGFGCVYERIGSCVEGTGLHSGRVYGIVLLGFGSDVGFVGYLVSQRDVFTA